MKRVGKPVLLASAALGFGAASMRGRGRALDDRLFAWANDRVPHPVLDRTFGAVTELGSFWAALAAGAVLAAAGHRREATRAVGAAGATWVLGQLLKRVFNRTRPYDAASGSRLLIARPQGKSWPSSHPAVYLTFATVAARSLGLSRRAEAALAVLAGVVASSRVYLGVHYPSDVVGGLLLGRAVAEAWPRPPRTVR